jgi:hypothetical protein
LAVAPHHPARPRFADGSRFAFSREAVELCLAEKGVTVEVKGGLLAACRIAELATAESYATMIAWMRSLATALQAT